MSEGETVDAIVAWLDRQAVKAAANGCFDNAGMFQSIATSIENGDWKPKAGVKNERE